MNELQKMYVGMIVYISSIIGMFISIIFGTPMIFMVCFTFLLFSALGIISYVSEKR